MMSKFEFDTQRQMQLEQEYADYLVNELGYTDEQLTRALDDAEKYEAWLRDNHG